MNTFTLSNRPFITICVIIYLLVPSTSVGFTTDLIHRDSPSSPFYDPSATVSRRVVAAFNRSFHRAQFFTSMRSGVTNIFPNPQLADYLMKLSIGTPPQQIIGAADTGSDIIWTQCKPCSYCFNQKLPLYTPENSSTYTAIKCDSTSCMLVPTRSCTASDNTCLYMVVYGDLSYSSGELATETVTLQSSTDRTVSLAYPRLVFGCGHRNAGMFTDTQSGIIGLGGGPFSLITQMGSSINRKFSYCLVQMFSHEMFSHEERSSKMYFGDDAVVAGDDIVSTPILSGYPDTFYYLKFEGMSVGGQRVDFNTTRLPNSAEGNIIIDSGTSLTFFPEEFYDRLQLAVRLSMKDIRPVGADRENNLKLCYNRFEVMDFPVMVAHFSGADLELDTMNSFVQIGNDSICLAFVPVDGVVIFGNIAQINFLVAYDLIKKTVSFKRTDCMKL